MTTNHIDQLAEWWSEAERAPFREGDVLIARFDARPMPFEIYSAACDSDTPADNVRILARAPKPKPAWHDAVAVIAEVHAFDLPRVFVKDDDGIWNDALTGRGYSSDALSHVTPLIEAKVTDEMVLRALNKKWNLAEPHLSGYTDEGAYLMRAALTAALGLDPV